MWVESWGIDKYNLDSRTERDEERDRKQIETKPNQENTNVVHKTEILSELS